MTFFFPFDCTREGLPRIIKHIDVKHAEPQTATPTTRRSSVVPCMRLLAGHTSRRSVTFSKLMARRLLTISVIQSASVLCTGRQCINTSPCRVQEGRCRHPGVRVARRPSTMSPESVTFRLLKLLHACTAKVQQQRCYFDCFLGGTRPIRYAKWSIMYLYCGVLVLPPSFLTEKITVLYCHKEALQYY